MKTEVIVDHLGGLKFEAKARKHSIMCDQPVENGGLDEGMTPPEFLLASLGTCAGYYAVQYLRTRNLIGEGLRVRTTAGKASAPARLADFRIEVEYPGRLDERHREGMLRAIRTCLIHNTLLNAPRIEVEIVEMTAPMAA